MIRMITRALHDQQNSFVRVRDLRTINNMAASDETTKAICTQVTKKNILPYLLVFMVGKISPPSPVTESSVPNSGRILHERCQPQKGLIFPERNRKVSPHHERTIVTSTSPKNHTQPSSQISPSFLPGMRAGSLLISFSSAISLRSSLTTRPSSCRPWLPLRLSS